MSRKRNSDESPVDTNSKPAGTAVADVPVGDTPVGEPTADGPGFADKVGAKKGIAIPDPFGIASDSLAGVRLLESRQDRQMAIKFGEGRPEDKPNQAVIDKMKEAGYRWNPADRIWAIPVRGNSAMSTRIAAEKLYQDVRQMIRQEKGIEPATPDIAF